VNEEEQAERVEKLARTIRWILQTYDWHTWLRLKRRCRKDEDIRMDVYSLAVNLDEVLKGGEKK